MQYLITACEVLNFIKIKINWAWQGKGTEVASHLRPSPYIWKGWENKIRKYEKEVFK